MPTLRELSFYPKHLLLEVMKKEDCIKNILFVISETAITVDECPYGLTKASLNSLVQGLAYRFARLSYQCYCFKYNCNWK